MKRLIMGALIGTTALIPAAFAQTALSQDALIAAGNDCERLGLVARAEPALGGFDYDGINTRISAADDAECRVGLQQFADADVEVARAYLVTAQADVAAPVVATETAEITVAVPQPQISVTQAQPQVTLRQAAADVQVQQPEPIISVQIPEPTVTVNQPRPEIIVRIPQPEIIVNMPDPTVNVAQAEPIISVEMPEPIVTVNIPQPEVSVAMAQPEVTVDQAEPQVAVADTGDAAVQVAASNAAAVTIDQAEPVVTVSRAEPRIDVQRGEAQVSIVEAEAAAITVEGTGEVTAAATLEETDANAELAVAPVVAVEADPVDVATTPVVVEDDVETTASVNDAAVVGVETNAITVEEILAMDLVGAAGEEIGDVERVISQNGALFLIVGNGGFLGLGEKQVAIPLADVTMADGTLYTREYTEEEVELMNEFDMNNVAELPIDQTAEIGLYR